MGDGRGLGQSQRANLAGSRAGYRIFYSISKTIRLMELCLSLLHSRAREVEILDCHRIVTKTDAKRGKISKLQKPGNDAI